MIKLTIVETHTKKKIYACVDSQLLFRQSINKFRMILFIYLRQGPQDAWIQWTKPVGQ